MTYKTIEELKTSVFVAAAVHQQAMADECAAYEARGEANNAYDEARHALEDARRALVEARGALKDA